MLKRIVSLFGLVLMLGCLSSGYAQRATDVVMVLPFENTSDKPEFNWVGESFALSHCKLNETAIPNSPAFIYRL